MNCPIGKDGIMWINNRAGLFRNYSTDYPFLRCSDTLVISFFSRAAVTCENFTILLTPSRLLLIPANDEMCGSNISLMRYNPLTYTPNNFYPGVIGVI